MLFFLRPDPLQSLSEHIKHPDALGRTKPAWQTQLWVEPVKPGVSSHSVLLLSENSALPLTSLSEAALGKPQGTYPPRQSEKETASIQALLYRSPDASETSFLSCQMFVVASWSKASPWLSPSLGIALRGSAEPLKQGRCSHAAHRLCAEVVFALRCQMPWQR